MKWNIKENTPIESGTTKEDVVHFVLFKMYHLHNKNKDGEDDNMEESEVDMALEVQDDYGDNISLSSVVDEVVPLIDEVENAIDDETTFLDDNYMFPGFSHLCFMDHLLVMRISWIFYVKVLLLRRM